MAIAIVLVIPVPVHANAELRGIEVSAVHEASHDLRISVDGLVASVASEMVIVNPGDTDTAVHYQFDLPPGAVVTGATVDLADGRRARSTSVDAEAVFRFVDEPGTGGAPDIGIVRRLPDLSSTDEVQRFEVRLSSIDPGKSAMLRLRWMAPLHYRDGHLWLRIPARGSGKNLVGEKLDVTWKAPGSARGLRDVRVGGTAARTQGRTVRLRATAPRAADIVVEARPVFAASQRLVVEHAIAPLDRQRGAAVMAVLAPGSAADQIGRFDRVVIVLDISRSLGAKGLAAVRTMASKLLTDISADTDLAVIAFDRQARELVGFGDERSTAMPAVLRGLPADNGRNGSDVESALVAVNTLLEPDRVSVKPSSSAGAHASTLVVVITDGQFPLDFDAQRARNIFQASVLRSSRFAAVLVVPDSAPLPMLERGPLTDLAERTGGRVMAVRHSEAAGRSARLWTELARDPRLTDLAVNGSGTWAAESRLPSTIEPGSGHWAIGWYHGKPPTVLTVTARHAETVIRSTSRAQAGSLRAAALPLALSQRGAHEIIGPDGADPSVNDEDVRMRAAHRAGIVTEQNSFVLWDQRDGFARDRIALAEKWGLSRYRRFPAHGEPTEGDTPQPRSQRRGQLTAARLSTRTGQLDKAIVERLIKTHVVPRARRCYERALRKQPDLSGSAVLMLEMSRGEVQIAHADKVTWVHPAMTDCLLEAAYSTPVPAVALGDDAEQVVVVRYPLRFRRIQKRIDVSPAPLDAPIDPADPLDGLSP